MKNTTKVWLFLIFLGFFCLIFGYKVADRLGLFLGFLVASFFMYLLFTASDDLLLRKLKAEQLFGQDPWNLVEKVTRFAHRMGLKAPRVYLMDHPTATAFSLGHPWGRAVVCVSRGLLQKLSPVEVDAILVHQVCHIRRMDTFAFGVSSLLANSILSLAELVDDLTAELSTKRIPKKWQKRLPQRPFRILLSPLAWLLIRLNVRDRNYFDNDDLAVQALPDRKILAQALWKLESLNQARPLDIPDCSSHLFVVDPRGLKTIHWFYTTHPKMNLRLQRLTGSEFI